jgi:cbb3-type cytochrome oxidase maturation protein
MNVLVYLVPMALGLGLTGLAAFLWSLRSGQYEDMDGAALRVLSDEDLDVEPQQVVLRQTESADGGFSTDAGVRSVPVVSVQPERQFSRSLS